MVYDLLPISDGVSTATSREVLSVDVIKQSTPVVTVNVNGKSSTYRLPNEYLSWVENCRSLTDYGVTIFPRNVAFGVVENNHYVLMLDSDD